jgi:hypothetical protein
LRATADCLDPGFYRRRLRTLFEPNASALRLLKRSELTLHAERGLVAYLRREAAAVFDQAELMARARSWLVEHHYLLLRERDIRRLVIAARRHHEQALFKLIAAALRADRESWVPRLLAPIEDGGISRCEWLGAVPSNKAAKGLAEQLEKVGFLKELGADRLVLPDLPLAGLDFRETDDVAETSSAGVDQGSASHDRGRLLSAPHAVTADGRKPRASRSPDRNPVA